MNYPTFLKKVDALSTHCDADSLRLFIHEYARTLEEEKRARFILLLGDFCDEQEPAPHLISQADDLDSRVDDILQALKAIRDGERELDSEYNERWNDWDDDEEEDEYEFSDPDGLLDDVNCAFDLMHECLDKEKYEKGMELARTLSQLEIQVSGDYNDYDESFGIGDLIYYHLLRIDLDQCINESLYLAYMRSADKAETMVSILDDYDHYSISLDDILRLGSKEIDLEKLLPGWIEALARRPGEATDELLIEAHNMLQDSGQILEYASRYATSHPSLYLNILQSEKLDKATLMMVGLKAMQEVPVEHPTRSAIALLTAEYAFDQGDEQTGEDCWLEAFRTSPNVTNYLRLRILGHDWSDISGTVRDIYEAYYSTKRSWDRDPLAALMFFDGRIDEMQNRFMTTKDGIGWSSTFMKEGISLLLLLLNRGEAQGPGMKAMVSRAVSGCSFNGADYRLGTGITDVADTKELFEDCFQRWKDGVIVSESESKAWIQKITGWIALRVSAIMDANRRNYYGECASFIAALGEALESRGQVGAKESLMQGYRQEYSRRRAFHEELRSYGMGR